MMSDDHLKTTMTTARYNNLIKSEAGLATLRAAIEQVRNEIVDGTAHVINRAWVVKRLAAALDAAPGDGATGPAILYHNPTFDDSEDFMDTVMDALKTGPKVVSITESGHVLFKPSTPPPPDHLPDATKMVGIDPAEVSEALVKFNDSEISMSSVARLQATLIRLIDAAGEQEPINPVAYQRHKDWLTAVCPGWELHSTMPAFVSDATEHLCDHGEPTVPVSVIADIIDDEESHLYDEKQCAEHPERERFNIGFNRLREIINETLAPYRSAPSAGNPPDPERSTFLDEDGNDLYELPDTEQADLEPQSKKQVKLHINKVSKGKMDYSTDAESPPAPGPTTEQRAAWWLGIEKFADAPIEELLGGIMETLAGQNDDDVRRWLAERDEGGGSGE